MSKEVQIKKSTKGEIKNIVEEYYKDITAPIDDMWENAIIGISDYYKVMRDSEVLGYFCLNQEGTLLQYFIRDEFISKSKEIFKYILEQYNIPKGFIGTNDIKSLALFLDFNKKVCTHTFLYKDIERTDIISPIKGIKILTATEEDLQKVMDYHINSLNMKGRWIKPYCSGLIAKGQIILFIKNQKIIGIGEKRRSETQEKYAHLGVTVAKEYRSKGVGSFILSYLKKECYRNRMIPICSTSIDNVASQKTIMKAGFFAYHRILEVMF